MKEELSVISEGKLVGRITSTPNRLKFLMGHVGRDCAGALQFIPRSREEELLGNPGEESIAWLSEDDLAQAMKIGSKYKIKDIQRIHHRQKQAPADLERVAGRTSWTRAMASRCF